MNGGVFNSFNLNPYAYCAQNPLKYVDPTGKVVKPADDEALEMIQNTVTPEESKYVKLDKNGCIDKKTINSYKGEGGENFNDLKNMINSKTTVDVELVPNGSQYSGGLALSWSEPFDYDYEFYGITPPAPEPTDLSTGENGVYGITLMPAKEALSPSPDKNIKVYINKAYSAAGRADAFAHEGYGHANFFINTKNYEKSIHQIEGNRDLNTPLIERIGRVMQETTRNMRTR